LNLGSVAVLRRVVVSALVAAMNREARMMVIGLGAARDSWGSERTGRAFSLWQSVQFCWCRGQVSSLGQPGVWAGTVALKENPPA
jgi:hypothetical protein